VVIVKEKKEKTQELEAKNQELLNDLKRLQAEFDNYRRREAENKKNSAKLANEGLVESLLSVVDNFQLAIKAAENQNSRQGIELIYSQLMDILGDSGLEEIQTEGKFDPELHEAMMKEQSDEEENSILEVFQQGYKFNGKVLRHAKVKVSGGKK
jgi:molecular chaperone GrpE